MWKNVRLFFRALLCKFNSNCRVSVQLNGFECHVYNRSAAYRELERKFGFETSRFFPSSKGRGSGREDGFGGGGGGGFGSSGGAGGGGGDGDSEEEDSAASSTSSYILGKNWRDLIPVIKIDLSSAKLAFGNRLLPTTLVLSADEAHCTYSTKPAGCPLDHFMHFIKCRVENFKILLAPSPKYTGLRDEAPRFMGEGFVVVATNTVNLYYYMDEAGPVPEDEAANASCDSPRGSSYPLPEWGVDIKCGKSTDFSYGPWADRQRELIYKFFFPQDYHAMTPTELPKPGQKRQAKLFRVRLSTEHPSTMDVLFSKQKETSAVHVNIGQGTNFELKVPWVVGENGYTSTITGTLMMVEATTSLPYRELVQAETLEFKVDMKYPAMWNFHQEWIFSFIGTKTSLNFTYAHKWFFQVYH